MANGRKPDFDVCVSKRSDDKTSRAVNVGAAWTGDKGQVNVRINVPPRVVGEFLADGYDFVLFENKGEF
jgi:predicted lipoprotein